VSLEWDKPLFDEDLIDRDEVMGLSSSLFLTGRMKVTDNFSLQAELPLSYFGYQDNNPFGGNDNSFEIGNVYLGGIYDIQTGSYDARPENSEDRLFVELGVRFPTAREPDETDNFGAFTGRTSEAGDRVEAFLYDTWSIPVIGSYISTISGPFAVKLRLGTIYDIYVGDFEGQENEMYLQYGIAGLYRESTLEASLGFSGRNRYVGNNPDFFDDGFTQVRASVARPFGNIVPGVYVRKPLGENYNNLVNLSYGFSVEIRR
jgi:hypothetical protein